MPDDIDPRKLLLGLAGQAARIGIKAGLAAFDSVLHDIEEGTTEATRRVKRSRKRVAQAAESVGGKRGKQAKKGSDEEE